MSGKSSRWIIDWFFARFMYVLTSSGWKIVWRRMAEKHAEVDFDTKTLAMNPDRAMNRTKKDILDSLVHELIHIVFGDQTAEETGIVPHQAVYDLEKIADHLTLQQRNMLLAALPPRPPQTKKKQEPT